MIVATYGGLANRLRVIFSYAAVGVRDFVWEPDGEICGARFGDVFEPIDGITIRDSGPHDLRTLDVAPRIHPDWVNRYRELWPVHWAWVSVLHKPYSAMHVRRTDHVGLALACNNFTTDDEFSTWLGSAAHDVYLATDNGTAQLHCQGPPSVYGPPQAYWSKGVTQEPSALRARMKPVLGSYSAR